MISLKAYNLEVEQLIDIGMYDDAVAHCIHILSTYPKCIDSYRNLGKALLEQKKYPEALDVFSRVLSAIPDDFISHVGLSIIFEDQKKLDLAIWHMEQAFDVQPSNLAIQDELKRLFGLRDGDAPAKIRLSRGALVRMYARGELFQQAITEILSILQEDPRRVDLEVILAKMHFLSGSFEESENECNRLLEKIPYCQEANRILQQIEINKNNIEAASIYRNRLVSLDPYYQFAGTPFSESEIPESKVQLQKLNYVSTSSPDVHVPEWLEEITTSSGNKSEESFTWLSDPITTDDANKTKSPFSDINQSLVNMVDNNEMKNDDDIPDWINAADWKPETNNTISGSDEQISFTRQDSHDENTKFSMSDSDNAKPSNVTSDDLASLFIELKEGKMADDELTPNNDDAQQFPPSEWMSQFSTSESSSSTDSLDQDFPDWLKNFQAEEPENSVSSEDMPDWLINLKPEDESPIQLSDEKLESNTIEDSNPFETQNILSLEQIETNENTPTNMESPFSTSDQDDGWERIDLINQADDELIGSKIKTDKLKPLSSDDKIPDWVKSVMVNQKSDDQAIQKQDSDSDSDNSAFSSESPEKDNSLFESSDTHNTPDEGIISQQTNDELLDWLRGLKTEEEPSLEKNEVLNSDQPLEIDEPMLGVQMQNDNVESESNQAQEEVDSIFEKVTNEEVSFSPESNAESVIDQNDPLPIQTDNTEYPNEMIESSSLSELEDIIDTPIIDDPKVITNIDASSESILELLTTNDFEKIELKITNLFAEGKDISPIITNLISVSDRYENDYAYWQCLGDIYSKNNQLNDALGAYQKSEDILLKTIST
ncbi:MAG: hypothetical protein CVU42_02560 [Chloroflexi bacterium HGW-Chloroflexi-4]|jgi:tetratricopeptide (TPR) repeat protein|nr:MAG: hypothetical protein CVU42_02560 [Chloroflexi bacterium HGW-Chloroflexi-4]